MKIRKKELLNQLVIKILKVSFPVSLGLYLFRGWGIISFLPGWILLVTITLSIFSLLGYLTLKTYN